MSRSLAVLAFCGLAWLAGSSLADEPTRRALFIGINQYQAESFADLSWESLWAQK